MADFFQRLRSELVYSGLLQKELAARAGIKKRALDAYLGAQRCMPPADVAVRLAEVLGVSVEYLVSGNTQFQSPALVQRVTEDDLKYRRLKDILDDMLSLPEETLTIVKGMIRAAARTARVKEGRKTGAPVNGS